MSQFADQDKVVFGSLWDKCSEFFMITKSEPNKRRNLYVRKLLEVYRLLSAKPHILVSSSRYTLICDVVFYKLDRGAFSGWGMPPFSRVLSSMLRAGCSVRFSWAFPPLCSLFRAVTHELSLNV